MFRYKVSFIRLDENSHDHIIVMAMEKEVALRKVMKSLENKGIEYKPLRIEQMNSLGAPQKISATRRIRLRKPEINFMLRKSDE